MFASGTDDSPVDLDMVFGDGGGRFGVFPCQLDLARGYFFQGDERGGRDVEAEFFNQDVVGGLDDGVGAPEKPGEEALAAGTRRAGCRRRHAMQRPR